MAEHGLVVAYILYIYIYTRAGVVEYRELYMVYRCLHFRTIYIRYIYLTHPSACLDSQTAQDDDGCLLILPFPLGHRPRGKGGTGEKRSNEALQHNDTVH